MLAALILAPALVTTVVNVSIEGFAFVPDSIAVNLGDTLRWTNKDGSTHTSTSTGGINTWNSGNLGQNKTYQKVFTTAGLSSYHCNIHSGMLGQVLVVDPNAPVAIHAETVTKSGSRAPAIQGSLRDARGRALESAPGSAGAHRAAVPAFHKTER